MNASEHPGSDRAQGVLRPGGFVAVVVAAGAGTRLGGGPAKALRLLAGRPLVRHAVDLMNDCGADAVVVVVPAGQEDAFAAVLPPGTTVIPGGRERQQSVLAGLAALPDTTAATAVLVHDAARPLVPAAVVRRVLTALADGAAAVIPVVALSDTVRQVSTDASVLLDRTSLRAVQTPQGFDAEVLLAAHRRFADTPVTDDATLCELAGHAVRLVEGSPESIKVTHPVDLVVAESLLAARAELTGSARA